MVAYSSRYCLQNGRRSTPHRVGKAEGEAPVEPVCSVTSVGEWRVYKCLPQYSQMCFPFQQPNRSLQQDCD